MSEVLEALDLHTKSVTEALTRHGDGLKQLRELLDDEKSEREALEIKLNELRRGGAGAGTRDEIEAPARFSAHVKSWYPNRLQGALDGEQYRGYVAGFKHYLRHGEHALEPEHRKTMSVGSDPDGGFLVPEELYRELVALIRPQTVIRRFARIIPTSSASLEIPVQLTSVESGWVGEMQDRTDTKTPQVGKNEIVAREWYAQPKVTQQLLDDSAFDIESFVNEQIAEQYAVDEDTAFLTGDGIARPRGILTVPMVATADATRPRDKLQYLATGQASALPTTAAATYDLLVSVVHSMKPRLRREAVWIGSTEIFEALAKLKDSQNRPLWVESVAADKPATLLGYPALETELMPGIGANTTPLMFANLKQGYWINDRVGLRMLRDPYTSKPFVKFYTTRRVGGGVMRGDAIKVIKVAAS